MAQSFIGKPISLISHSDVRYRGILAGIDPAASTIQLSNVFSMGTETRRPPAEFIPPVQDPYQYIIFRASEVKDLAVDEPAPPPRRSVHDDPAVLAAPPPFQAPAQPQPQQQPPPSRRNPNPVHTAAASLETVERALGDLRVSNSTTARGRARPTAARAPSHAQLTVPTTDFDFASMNAKFDKAALGLKGPDVERATNTNGTPAPEVNSSSPAPPHPNPDTASSAPTTSAYDPAKSFFDSLSPMPLRGGRRGGARGEARSRREEERERNVATFGEPGGHAHAYVGAGAGVGGYAGMGPARRAPRRGRGVGVGVGVGR